MLFINISIVLHILCLGVYNRKEWNGNEFIFPSLLFGCLDVKFGGTVESKIHLFINQKLNVHKGI